MAKRHTKPTITKNKVSMKLPPAKKPAWVDEEEAAPEVATPKATPKAKEPKAPKEKGEGRKPNLQSFRWVAITIIRDNPGKSQEELIALMDKAKPGKTGAYWKRRIARAYHLTKKFAVLGKDERWVQDLPARPVAPKTTDDSDAEEV